MYACAGEAACRVSAQASPRKNTSCSVHPHPSRDMVARAAAA